MNRFAIFAVLGALAACDGDTDKGDSGDTTDTTDTPPGALVIDEYSVTCTGGQATFTADMSGESYDGLVVAQETASTYEDEGVLKQNQEEHDLTTGGDGTTMSVTVDANDAFPGIFPSERNVATTFTCDDHINLPNFMSYAFFAYGSDGAIVDCLAGGHDGAGLVAGDYQDAAVNSGGHPMSAEAEAFLPNCVVGSPSR